MIIKNKKALSMMAALTAYTVFASSFTSHAMSPDAKVTILESQKAEVLSGNTEGMSKGLAQKICQEGQRIAEEKRREKEEAIRIAEEERLRAEEEARRAAEEAQRAMEGDQRLLASIIFCEAGNQPYEGQVAVGAVVLNRVRSGRYPGTIRDVLYQSGQFGPAMTGWLDKVYNSGSYSGTAMQAAQDALAGSNPVGNSLSFGNGSYGIRIGDHYFH